jgi:hypothetical protein
VSARGKGRKLRQVHRSLNGDATVETLPEPFIDFVKAVAAYRAERRYKEATLGSASSSDKRAAGGAGNSRSESISAATAAEGRPES